MKKPTYCTQNDGDCKTCSLVNYGRDCRNNPIGGGDRLVPPCPHCGSAAVRKRGTDTKSGGIKVQTWHCRECGRTYREDIDKDGEE